MQERILQTTLTTDVAGRGSGVKEVARMKERCMFTASQVCTLTELLLTPYVLVQDLKLSVYIIGKT